MKQGRSERKPDMATLDHIEDFEEGLVKSEAFYYAL
jgi:hypothetical protein